MGVRVPLLSIIDYRRQWQRILKQTDNKRYKKINLTTLNFRKWFTFYLKFFAYSTFTLPTNSLRNYSLLCTFGQTDLRKRSLQYNLVRTYFRHNKPDLTNTFTPSGPGAVNLENTFSFFKEYWQVYQSKGVARFSLHREFRLIFFTGSGGGAYDIMSLQHFYTRWESGCNLIFNIVYFDATIFAFTHKLFIEEALTFNWLVNLMSYKLFRYSQGTFYLKNSPYGEDSKLSYNWSHLQDMDAAIVSDVKYHQGSVFFLQTFHIYTIGLVPASRSPWILSFGMPLMGESLAGQLYFFGLVFRLSQQARTLQYDVLTHRWMFIKRTLNPITPYNNPDVMFFTDITKGFRSGKFN